MIISLYSSIKKRKLKSILIYKLIHDGGEAIRPPTALEPNSVRFQCLEAELDRNHVFGDPSRQKRGCFAPTLALGPDFEHGCLRTEIATLVDHLRPSHDLQ